MPKTFTIDAARDGCMFSQDYVCETADDARSLILEDINQAWRQEYEDFEEMEADSDGCCLVEHPAVMAERIPAAEMALLIHCRALVGQIARMTTTVEADGADLDNDTAMDGLIARARSLGPVCPDDGNLLADDGVCGFCGNTPAAYAQED